MQQDDMVRQRAEADAAAWRESAERWRPHATRTDSLGETARRKHTRALDNAWAAENRLALATPPAA